MFKFEEQNADFNQLYSAAYLAQTGFQEELKKRRISPNIIRLRYNDKQKETKELIKLSSDYLELLLIACKMRIKYMQYSTTLNEILFKIYFPEHFGLVSQNAKYTDDQYKNALETYKQMKIYHMLYVKANNKAKKVREDKF